MGAGVSIAIAVVLAVATIAPAALADAVTERRPAWVPDGEVKAVAISGSTAYIGGNFSRIAPYTGSSALFDAATGQRREPWPEVDGVVNAIVSDNAGGWYLGGDFRSVGGVERIDLAHVLADGTLDPSWAPSTNGEVRALATQGVGGVVYAGGEFTAANGQTRGNLAGFAAADGALTSFSGAVSTTGGSPFDPPGVHALVQDGTALFAGGEFFTATGTTSAARSRGAAFNVVTNQLLAWDPSTNRVINGLARSGAALFIGGRFSTAGGQPRNGVAQVNDTTGAVTTWEAPLQPSTDLTELTVGGDWVYLGGTVRVAPGEVWPAAAYNVTNAGLNINWHPIPVGGVTALAATPTAVYIGSGAFTDGPQPAIIGVHPTNIPANPSSFAPALGRGRLAVPSGQQVGVRAIGATGSDVVAGGTFINVGGVERRNLAAIDLTTGEPTAFDPPMKGQFSALASVRALALADGLVWAGGEFVTPDPGARIGLAAFDAASGALASFDLPLSGSGNVSALAASGSTVYVGGSFSTIGGMERRNIAAVQHVPGGSGTVLPFDVHTDGPVRVLALGGGALYLGGQFQNINGALASLLKPRSNLAAVDPVSGLGSPFDPNVDAPVNALAIDAGTIFAGGEFATVNGALARQRLAAFDAVSGAARAWAPGADAAVRALAVHGPAVFAGGEFANVNGGVPRSGFAAFDSQTGAPDPDILDLASEDRTGTPGVLRVGSLAASPQAGLIAGGAFVLNAPAPPAANLALFGLPPLPPAGPPGGTPADTIDPDLALSASRRRFGVGPGAMPLDGDATAAQRRRGRRAPKGTRLRLQLSEAARVRFDVLRKSRGRRVGGRCVKPTRRNRGRRRCTRLTRKGGFTRSAPAGRSSVAWSGRIRRRALKRGPHLVRATPTDAAGNAGRRRSLSIRIVR